MNAAPPNSTGSTTSDDAPRIIFQRSVKARRYRLTLRPDGAAVAVIPVRGSLREAEEFVARHHGWLERARERQRQRPRAATIWTPGTAILWRGELTEIRVARSGVPDREGNAAEAASTTCLPPNDGAAAVCLAADVFRVRSLEGDLRAALETQFARRAKIELPARTWELAAETSADVKQVTVRNQRSRWGSCSVRGTISLNWRLVQTPDFVRDYIIYHELAHLREMNHSDRFWARVEATCPGWRDAEQWLKRHGRLLGL